MANSLCLRQSEFGPAGNFYSNFPQREAQESAVIGRNKVLHSINIRNANAKLKLTPIVWDTVAVGAVEQQPIPPGTLQSQPLDLVKKLKPCILPSSLPSSRRWLLFEVADEGTIFSVRVITGAWGFGWAKGDTLELGAVNDGVEPPAFIAA